MAPGLRDMIGIAEQHNVTFFLPVSLPEPKASLDNDRSRRLMWQGVEAKRRASLVALPGRASAVKGSAC
jgi:hypothetical protein